jgi:low temperature requirement protein LtrA
MPSLPFVRPMLARRIDEPHRASTPLELLFDLCFVVAVAQLVDQWHHAVIAGDFQRGILHFGVVFFAIWWSWVNFTWFASAFDTDDVAYRICVLVQIAGNLIIAAGVPRAFANDDLTILTIGYTVMRLALVTQWLRAWRADPAHQSHAGRYALGVTLIQIGWLLRLLLPGSIGAVAFLPLALIEITIPFWAELRNRTNWHPFHIAERYGLFTLIVLGESVLGATVSFQTAVDEHQLNGPLLAIALGALLIFFSMWWLYFDREDGLALEHFASRELTLRDNPFVYGYGHLFIFAFAAAVGAGVETAVDVATDHTSISTHQASAAIAVPVTLFVISLFLLRVFLRQSGPGWPVAFGLASLLMLGTIALANPVLPLGLIAAGLVAWVVKTTDVQSEIEPLRGLP